MSKCCLETLETIFSVLFMYSTHAYKIPVHGPEIVYPWINTIRIVVGSILRLRDNEYSTATQGTNNRIFNKCPT